jgi:putative transposase
MHEMGLAAIYPKPKLSKPGQGVEHRIYPYLLRGRQIDATNQVWSTDITFVPMPKGYVYLVAIMDWYSRYVLAWELSVTMETEFCLEALSRALQKAQPEIFNTDQDSQFTSLAFTGWLLEKGIRISMDGRGRCFDNIWLERRWRSVKQEEVYLKNYGSVEEALFGPGNYFDKYNHYRPHQSLD